MSEKLTHLKAALQLAEMHLAANSTDFNQAKVESAEREYQQALELEEVILADGGADSLAGLVGKIAGIVEVAGIGQAIISDSQEDRIQELEAALAGARALLNQQANEKAGEMEEAEKLAPAGVPVSGEPALSSAPAALTIPAAPVVAPIAPAAPAVAPAAAVKPAAKPASKPAAKPAAKPAEAEVKKN